MSNDITSTSAKELDIRETRAQMLKGFQDYLDNQDIFCADNILSMQILPKFLQLQNDKGRLYGRSYAKHGSLSIFFNLERKWDRIENIMNAVMKNGVESLYSEESSTATETVMDTIVDLAIYAIMWAGYIKETHPEVYDKFLKSNNL